MSKIKKISIAEYNRIILDVKEAYADYIEAKADAVEAEQCQIMPNCPKCQGEGEVDDGTGDPAHNPYGHMLRRVCYYCKGKGYV